MIYGIKVGDRVVKRRCAHGIVFDGDRANVERVTQTCITLDDGSKWRANSGIAWGAKSERGVGTSHAWRIEVDEA